MMDETLNIKDAALARMLDEAVFGGWTRETFENVLAEEGLERAEAEGLFPDGVKSMAAHFSDWADRQMLEKLADDNVHPVRVRDKVSYAVLVRLGILEAHKMAVQSAASYWWKNLRAHPLDSVWKTADAIWVWAGDEATDYNHYTKRSLLSMVIISTTLFWLNDKSENHSASEAFLERRISNVLFLGKTAGRIISLWPFGKKNKDKSEKKEGEA